MADDPDILLDDEGDDDLPVPEPLVGGETRAFTLTKDSEMRLDKYLQNRVKGFSRHQIQRIIDLGGVTLNDKPTKASAKLRDGDVVQIHLPPRPTSDLKPQDLPIQILHEEAGFIVVNKPANMIVHPARGRTEGTLLNALAYHFQQQQHAAAERGSASEAAGIARETDADGLSTVGREEARPGVIHRLDMNTTGVIVVGKHEQQHWKIAKQFENRTNLKAYLAVVHGCPDPPGGAIDQPLGKHPTIREAMCVRQDHAGKDSLTLYRVRERYRGYSLVECELKTGRTHQIRVHMSYIGHPLVGDLIYGGELVGEAELADPPYPAAGRPFMNFARSREDGLKLEAVGRERAAAGDLLMGTPALHAALLRLRHPDTDQPMTFTAPVPDPMLTLIRRLREQPEPGPIVTDGTHVDLATALPG